MEGELPSEALPSMLREALAEKLAESLSAPLIDATPRHVHGTVAFKGKATTVIGMRRVGKTTFLHQIRRERLSKGVPRENLPYVNFEDERLAGMTANRFAFLVDEFDRRVPDARQRGSVTWCFDEIQVVPGWERFVRRLLDADGNEIIVTGSSAALLSREVATSLRGRGWEVPLYPFSFGEALADHGHAVPWGRRLAGGREQSKVEGAFLDWLTVGGFPEAQGLDADSRVQLLRDYVDVAILRDVVERHAVSNVAALRWLVRHLLGNAAGLFSVEKFYAALKSQGIAVSKDTVHQLLAQIEDCFLVRSVWMEATSERQRMVNPRKTYPVDPALIPIFDRSGRRNVGHALETAVLIELERRRLTATYVRTEGGHEVDFLVRSGTGEPELIQVCADASDPVTAERELRGLAEAGANHRGARKRLLTLNRDGAPSDAPRDVVVQPAYEWMLEEPGGR
jgi:predicted AAA+ superfamily ATPase